MEEQKTFQRDAEALLPLAHFGPEICWIFFLNLIPDYFEEVNLNIWEGW